jgi:hypothetical protein
MRFVEVHMKASVSVISDLQEFYLRRLGFSVSDLSDRGFSFAVGTASARFTSSEGRLDPFYHFAFLVPGDRFDAARAWLADRTELLADPETGDELFDFSNWDALACYCHDPAGNIVELIAHSGVSESYAEGTFHAGEFVDFSEVGVVVPDKVRSIDALRTLGLQVWEGEVEDERRLVFVGEKARTLILSPAGRGWLPTGHPAEIHPMAVTVKTPHEGHVTLPGTDHVIRSI